MMRAAIPLNYGPEGQCLRSLESCQAGAFVICCRQFPQEKCLHRQENDRTAFFTFQWDICLNCRHAIRFGTLL